MVGRFVARSWHVPCAGMLMLAALAGGLLTGCSSGTHGFPVAAGNTAAGGPATTTTAAPARQSTECTTSDLSITIGSADAGAGQVTMPLRFTNSGQRTCTMQAYPGVSYVAGDDGHQVGDAATRMGQPGPMITLKPGEVASAMIHEPDGTSGYDPADCQLGDVRGYRVYPPDSTASAFVADDHQVCTASGGHFLTVDPLVAGDGGSGGSGGGSTSTPATSSPAGSGDDLNFIYVAGQQYVDADGASVQMYQAQPEVSTADGHSLQELAVQSADSQQIVEIGWTVDRATNGDSAPHLFVFHWVNGQPTCYNACGFVETAPSAGRPGMPVTVGQQAGYAIEHFQGAWWIGYNNQWFGYYPDSLWHGTYTKAGRIQTFGEVAAAGPTTCTDMGDGQFGNQQNASYITGFQLLGTNASPSLSMSATDPAHYSSGSATATSFRLGGPGTGPC